MLGYKMYVKSSEMIAQLSYEEIAEKLKTKENILVSIYKEIHTNDLEELVMIIKGNICTKINDMVINNGIKTIPKWYKVKGVEFHISEEEAYKEGLEELNLLCDRLNIKDKEILKNLRSLE